MPPSLRAPAGSTLAFEVQAEGVQVYACAASGGSFAWTFRAPEAKLFEPGGQPAGTHYAGPTWEAGDGSKVVGAKVEGATPDPGAIPWLLLRATSHSGSGRMQQVTFVQRLQTSGGNAPGSSGFSPSTFASASCFSSCLTRRPTVPLRNWCASSSRPRTP